MDAMGIKYGENKLHLEMDCKTLQRPSTGCPVAQNLLSLQTRVAMPSGWRLCNHVEAVFNYDYHNESIQVSF